MLKRILDSKALLVLGNGVVARRVLRGTEEYKETIGKTVNHSVDTRQEVIAPNLLQRLTTQLIMRSRHKASHRLRNFIITAAVITGFVTQVFMVFHLNAYKTRFAVRGIKPYARIESRIIIGITRITPPGGVFVSNLGHPCATTGEHLSKDRCGQPQVKLQGRKQVEDHRLAGQQIVIHPLLLNQAAFLTLATIQGITDDLSDIISHEIGASLLRPWHGQHGPPWFAFELTDRQALFDSPNGLKYSGTPLEVVLIDCLPAVHGFGKLSQAFHGSEVTEV